jgi:hypothetical protein
MGKNKNIEVQLKNLKVHYPFLSDDVLYALLMMGIYLMGNQIPFMLVGSIAWKALGLPLNRDIRGIDLEIICKDDEKLKIFEDICKEQGSKLHENEERISHFENKPYVFYAFGIECKVWVSRKNFYHKRFLKCGGIMIPTADEIINIKNLYHRQKDLDDLLLLNKEILTIICGKDNLDKFLDKININEIEDTILNNKED